MDFESFLPSWEEMFIQSSSTESSLQHFWVLEPEWPTLEFTSCIFLGFTWMENPKHLIEYQFSSHCGENFIWLNNYSYNFNTTGFSKFQERHSVLAPWNASFFRVQLRFNAPKKSYNHEEKQGLSQTISNLPQVNHICIFLIGIKISSIFFSILDQKKGRKTSLFRQKGRVQGQSYTRHSTHCFSLNALFSQENK